ncbi:MAG: TrmH family RNA methyltransferase [Candidatus Carsonella ruddii]|nr:MAG: TrmH family RNA methyltransferase [Candidatus Carsonella ruddii]WMC19521.1 MAG: TrmH family RNA methyltransferase [Candidatus Carsonella ruddii]
MIIINFRKILKKIKLLISLKIFFLICNTFLKKKKFFKCNFFFLYIKNIFNNFFLIKNFVILFLLNNIGNINSCIRTNYLFNVISVIKKKKKKKINSNYNNIFLIKNLNFFLFFIKKKNILISLTTKSFFFLKQIIIKNNFSILIGNEKKSIKKIFFLKSDILLKIKTYCKKSLNVNVVNGIILYKLI